MTAHQRGDRVVVLVARFNSMVTELLLDGALRGFTEAGFGSGAVEVVHVPGAWELPQAARRAADTGRYAAIVAIGCVIRGETAHFDYVAGEACYGLGAVAREIAVPLIFGVLTTENAQQALDRAGPGAGDKGKEFALSAVEMIEVYNTFSGSTAGEAP